MREIILQYMNSRQLLVIHCAQSRYFLSAVNHGESVSLRYLNMLQNRLDKKLRVWVCYGIYTTISSGLLLPHNSVLLIQIHYFQQSYLFQQVKKHLLKSSHSCVCLHTFLCLTREVLDNYLQPEKLIKNALEHNLQKLLT